MRTFDELEALLASAPPRPTDSGTVRLVCLRKVGGAHETPSRAWLSPKEGARGDRWALGRKPKVDAQVTLIDARVAAWLCVPPIPLDAPGDNLHVDLDLAEAHLPAGTRLRIGEALVQLTKKPHTGCGKFRDKLGEDALRWVNDEGHAGRRLRGVNCRVIAAGWVRVGDSVRVEAP